MRFGYSTNAFVKFSLTEAVKKIAALGFKAVMQDSCYGEKDPPFSPHSDVDD